MIEAKNLCRLYDKAYAVRDVNFHVKRGEVMGLLGPNGAGKSTTMKMLTCFLPPSSGDISIAGIDIQHDLDVRRKIGYLPEHAPLYHDLDVQQHLLFIGRMHGIPKATLQDKIIEMSGACGLQTVLTRRIDTLSKGYRQRVGLAASMLHDPECLILDEPTTGLDPNQMVEIRQLIRRLGEKKTVLLSSHILSEVDAVCDRMMIMNHGEVQAMGSHDELVQQSAAGISLHIVLRGDAEKFIQMVVQAYPDCIVANKMHEDKHVTRLLLKHADCDVPLAEKVFVSAVAVGAVLLELRPEVVSLEDVFHCMTVEKI